MLYHNPPHRVSSYSTTTAKADGWANTTSATLVQADIPCSINTTSADEQERQDQPEAKQVTHTVAILSAALTSPIARDMKLVASTGEIFHVLGIRAGRAMGSIPAFTYVTVHQMD